MNGPDAPPAWQVIGQLPTSGTDMNGTFGDGYRVTYRTASGLEEHVFFLRADYTPDRVRAAIQAEVDNHNAIAGLSG